MNIRYTSEQIACLASALLFVFAAPALGQSINGRITGTVLDAQEAAIPNAKVTVRNQATGISWDVVSDSRGVYVAPSLPAGQYAIRVEASGFRPAVSPDNTVSVAQTTRVDVRLEVGAVAEAVEVHAEAPLVQSATSDVGETVQMRQIQSLPLNGRIFSQLVQLVPGAIPRGFDGTAAESGSSAGARTFITSSVNGVPWSGTSFTLDGVNNAEPLNAFINVAPPIEAIEEFKVQTSNPNAEFGTFGGAVVNLTLRSGSNEFHGSLFEYLRNDALNARNFFATTKAPFKTNQFGGTFGGPIIKNKAFFFGDYQGMRLRQGQAYLFNVPTAAMRQGILLPSEGFSTIYDPDSSPSSASVTAFPDNRVPMSRWDPIAAKVLQLWPQPNLTPDRPGGPNYFENASNAQNVNAFDVKFDYQFERFGRVFARESYSKRFLDQAPPGNQFIMADPDSESRSHNAVVGHSVAFTPNLVNELRLGYNRFNTFHSGNDFGIQKNNELGIKNGNLAAYPESSGIANFIVDPLRGFGAPGWTNALRLANVYELTNSTTWIRGGHTFKWGADFRRIRSTLTNPETSARGSFRFNRDMTSQAGNGGAQFATFLLGYPSEIQRGLVNTRPDVRMVQGGVYFQDDWRVSRSLTLNLGLRWDLFTHPIEGHDRHVNFDPRTGKFNAATPDNRGPNLDTRKTNFAPRFGFAYSPNQGKLAFRGAVGISYFTDNFGANGGTLERNFPLFQNFGQTPSVQNRPFAKLSVDGLPAPTPTPLAPVIDPIPGITAFYVPHDFRQGTVNMWNIGVQRQLGGSGVVDAAYVATRVNNIFRGRNINIPYVPGPGAVDPRRPYYSVAPLIQNITERGSNGKSQYDSLQVKYTRRYAQGLQGLFSYTYAHSHDNVSTILFVWDDKLNWFPSHGKALDLRHVFTSSWTYELPFGKGRQFLTDAPRALDLIAGGWGINGITTMRTGEPLRVQAANQQLNIGTTNNFAKVTCSEVGMPKSVSQWFDTSCFSDPDPYTFGNAKPGVIRGPGVINFDLSAFKTFALQERTRLEFRAEFFNAFNNPHFANPEIQRSAGANFGRITSTILTPREVQLGLKLSF